MKPNLGLQEKIRKSGLKATAQKVAILDIFLKNHKPLSVKNILEKIIQSGNIEKEILIKVLEQFKKDIA